MSDILIQRLTEEIGLYGAQTSVTGDLAPHHDLSEALGTVERELDSLRGFKAGVDEALNSGDGSYRP